MSLATSLALKLTQSQCRSGGWRRSSKSHGHVPHCTVAWCMCSTGLDTKTAKLFCSRKTARYVLRIQSPMLCMKVSSGCRSDSCQGCVRTRREVYFGQSKASRSSSMFAASLVAPLGAMPVLPANTCSMATMHPRHRKKGCEDSPSGRWLNAYRLASHPSRSNRVASGAFMSYHIQHSSKAVGPFRRNALRYVWDERLVHPEAPAWRYCPYQSLVRP